MVINDAFRMPRQIMKLKQLKLKVHCRKALRSSDSICTDQVQVSCAWLKDIIRRDRDAYSILDVRDYEAYFVGHIQVVFGINEQPAVQEDKNKSITQIISQTTIS